MLFGSRDQFGLQVDPVSPRWAREDLGSGGPWANLRVYMNSENLSRFVFKDSETLEDAVCVQLAPIADWFVSNILYIAYEENPKRFSGGVDLHDVLRRWRAVLDADDLADERYAWTDRHFWRRGGAGAWLPDLAFVRSDDRLWISAGLPRLPDREPPRFLYQPGTISVPWENGLDAISSFVAQVLSWMGADDGRDPIRDALKMDWRQFASSEVWDGQAFISILANAEIDADGIAQDLGFASESSPWESVAVRAFRDLVPERAISQPLRTCESFARTTESSAFRQSRDRFDSVSLQELSPEDQGYRAANDLRSAMSLDDEPISESVDELARTLGIEVEHGPRSEDRNFMVSGARTGHAGRIVLLDTSRTRRPWASRMEVFRGIGHLLLDQSSQTGAIGAGSSLRAAGPRRRRSGTFAAELAVSRGALTRTTGGRIDVAASPSVFTTIMEQYRVGAHTAAYQLWNHGLLSSPEVRDSLIDEYASSR